MTVATILNERDSGAVTVRGDTSVAAAIEIMRAEGTGALVISDDGRRITGILAERDLIGAFRALGSDRLERVTVAEITRPGAHTCRPDDSLRHVMARMTARRIGHLPVVDGNGLRGVISMSEIVARRLRQAEMAVAAIDGTRGRRHTRAVEQRNIAVGGGRAGSRDVRIVDGGRARTGPGTGTCS